MSYESLLKRARGKLPESVFERARFEIPAVQGHFEGNKTVISNFHKIADALRRTPEHMLKFILKELATPGVFKRDLLMLGTKVPSARVNEKISQYAQEFVLCNECGKPDTNLQSEGPLVVLVCQACGAKRGVKAKI